MTTIRSRKTAFKRTAQLTAEPAKRRARSRANAVRHVLAATDLSPVGNAAIPHALSLLPDDGRLTLMHVTPMAPIIRAHVLGVADAEHRSLAGEIRAVSEHLRGLVPAEAWQRGIVVRIEVIPASNAGLAISEAARRVSADVICMGSGNRSDFSRAMLGSVTRTTLSHARRPLLLVPAPRD